METIKFSTGSYLDISKDQMYEIPRSSQNLDHLQDDIFSEEMERFNDTYGKHEGENKDEIFDDLKDLFKNESIQISSDYKLFLDRCETFRNKKNITIEETLYIQEKFLKYLNKFIESCLEMEKEFKNYFLWSLWK